MVSTVKKKKWHAENNMAINNGRITEGCWVNMGHSSKESPIQRGLARSYAPHGMKSIRSKHCVGQC